MICIHSEGCLCIPAYHCTCYSYMLLECAACACISGKSRLHMLYMLLECAACACISDKSRLHMLYMLLECAACACISDKSRLHMLYILLECDNALWVRVHNNIICICIPMGSCTTFRYLPHLGSCSTPRESAT